MKIDLQRFRQTFLEECAEHMMSMESAVLALRSDPANAEKLTGIFRCVHSIKGGAGPFGLNNVVPFTHVLEDFLDRLQGAEGGASSPVIDLLLDSIDALRGLLASEQQEGTMPAKAAELIVRLKMGLAGAAVSRSEGSAKRPGAFVVNFRPNEKMSLHGLDPALLLRNLAALGTVTSCKLHREELPGSGFSEPTQSPSGWTVELATRCGEAELRSVFEFAEGLAEVEIRALARTASPMSVAPETMPDAVPSGRETTKVEVSSIRVSTEKVDRLIDLVGELVIAHGVTAQIVDGFTPNRLPLLREAVASMERHTRELHERVMAIRTLPVGSLFPRYGRILDDIARATGKVFRLEVEGEETEIDKSMLEGLSDPLTHLVRNAADHGIETPGERELAGKPREGRIAIRAFHRSGKVIVEMADDGRGIDPDYVRAKAVAHGILSADAPLDDRAALLLIFEPGFSTREEVSNLSGRGVGMDVVKRNIQQMNGAVGVRSEKGRGTTVSIELPLTLAVLEGLLVRVADRTLVLPLLSVVETFRPRGEQMLEVPGKGQAVLVRGEAVPLLQLRSFLGLAQPTEGLAGGSGEVAPRGEGRALAVVVEAGLKKIGLIVDELLGQQQVVVKSLERHMHKVTGLMGATILGDGCVAPIVDVAGLASLDLFALSPRAHAPQ